MNAAEVGGAAGVDARTAELATRLAAVRDRIARSARSAGRDPSDVRLIVITKTWPADDVHRLSSLGVTDVGENRDQEASEKAAACAGLPLTWHFVGQLQRNKARSVARYADFVHAVDRLPLVAALSRAATARPEPLGVFVQADLAGAESLDPRRGGAPPAGLRELCDAVAEAAGLRLVGLMAIAPLGEDPATAFARLAALRADVTRDHPRAHWLSAGMSGDLEAAIAAGATHVRVGAAVLGERPHVR